jgi:hypothetical protein
MIIPSCVALPLTLPKHDNNICSCNKTIKESTKEDRNASERSEDVALQ